jgi:cytochrome c-type biogenesis protein CcmH/NrfG
MRGESIAYAIAGVLFGLIAGWVIGSGQASNRPPTPAAQAATAPAASGAPPPLDEAAVSAYRTMAEREPTNAEPRVRLGNLYFDAERFNDAIVWYVEALKLQPDDPDVSTDLGVSYYYTNQHDKALEQFNHSLKVNPRHTKTILNVGIVKAQGKQDLAGAIEAWEQVVKMAPDSPEGQTARQLIDSLRSAHPDVSQRPGA